MRALLALAAFAAACSEPRYATLEDGSDAARTVQPDAGAAESAVDVDAAVSQETLVCDAGNCEQPDFAPGQYAILARSYGGSTTAGEGWFGEQSVLLAKVWREDDEGPLRMDWEICDYRGVTAVPWIPTILYPLINYALVSPQALPRRSVTLHVVGDQFETRGSPMAVGYEELSEASCPAGTTQVHADRPWLPNGRCKCPVTSDPPTSIEDCRVIDPDTDGQPAVTVRLSGGMDGAIYTRIRDSSQIQGRIAKDGRHSGTYVAALDTYHLTCAQEPCVHVPLGLCPWSANPALFLPLTAKATGEPWTCPETVVQIDATAQLGLGPISKPGC